MIVIEMYKSVAWKRKEVAKYNETKLVQDMIA